MHCNMCSEKNPCPDCLKAMVKKLDSLKPMCKVCYYFGTIRENCCFQCDIFPPIRPIDEMP